VEQLTLCSPQGPPGCGLLLFRGGAEASCQKGERVLLAQYLGHSGSGSFSPTVHLICTQVSEICTTPPSLAQGQASCTTWYLSLIPEHS
jgi:hypothetical protein